MRSSSRIARGRLRCCVHRVAGVPDGAAATPPPPSTHTDYAGPGSRGVHARRVDATCPAGPTIPSPPRGPRSSSAAARCSPIRRSQPRLAVAVRRKQRRSTAANDDAVRAFFAAHFSPYRIAAEDGSDVGLVTGYYEPLLAGSRTPTADYAVPLYAPPDDLLVVDLVRAASGAQGQARARPRRRQKVVPYWSRAELERGARSLAGKALAYVADPVEAFFLEIQGSGRIALDRRSVMRLNYADQNGHPYRSVARVLIDRGELTRERASMQAISALGARRIPDRRARCSTRIRATCSSAKSPRRAPRLARRGDRRPARHARRAAARRAHDRRRRALHSARRAGVSRDHEAAVGRTARAAHAGAGHGRRDPRPGARRFLLGLRRRGRARSRAACGRRGGCGSCGRRARRCRRPSSPACRSWRGAR